MLPLFPTAYSLRRFAFFDNLLLFCWRALLGAPLTSQERITTSTPTVVMYVCAPRPH